MAPQQRRLTQHLVIRRADAEWVSSDCWVPRFAPSGGVHPSFLAGLAPWQRTVLGCPPAGWRQSRQGVEPELYPELRAEHVWSSAVLRDASSAAEDLPIPEDPTQRTLPNGAMGGPALSDGQPAIGSVTDGGAVVASLAALPVDGGAIDALAVDEAVVARVANWMDCSTEDVRLCRSEVMAIVPRSGAAGVESTELQLWDYQGYSLLAADAHAETSPAGIACVVFHFADGGQPAADLGITLGCGEHVATVRGGDAFFFDASVAHTLNVPTVALKDKAVRCSVLLWRRREAEWIGWEAWAKRLSSGPPSTWLATLSPQQRCLFGWPAVGSAYWLGEGLTGAVERYGEAMRAYGAGPRL